MMSDPLEKTIAAFKQWRINKTSKSSATPTQLRQQAVALLPLHSKGTVTTSLHISGGQLNQWLSAHQSSSDSTHFIQLPALQTPPQLLTIEVKLANGDQLSIAGELDHQVITQLIGAMKL